MSNFFVSKQYSSEIEVKKSKFISFIVPYVEFGSLHKELKEKHPKASHIVWAYRYLNEYGQIVENSTDDGEPKGVAGKPTLKVMQGKNIINSAILTVRYFGGIKLGMGGMVRGYSDSANELTSTLDLIEYKELDTKQMKIEYKELSRIEYLAQKYSILVVDKEFSSDVLITLKAQKSDFNDFEKELKGE
jgi:uncharacterized YigZ family protein